PLLAHALLISLRALFVVIRRPPCSPLFPYTTLFRSIGLAARRALQQQRDLAVGDGLLGQVVVDDQGVFATIAEVFAHGAAGVGRSEEHTSELQSRFDLVCRLLLEKKKKRRRQNMTTC